ncbi:MAG: cytochrome c3 family protein [Kiritimatiellia bacterium]
MAQPVRKFLRQAAMLLLAAVLFSGCDRESDYTLAFSHSIHVTDNGVACADCHGKMVEGGRFGRPAHAACKECHGDWVETKSIAADTCGKCHKIKDLKTLAPGASDKPADKKADKKANALFVHTDALAKRCADCHGALLDKKLEHVPEMTHPVKVRIREQAHRWGMACAACHAEMDAKTPPPNHRQNWTKQHGALGTQPDNACGMCHRDESCRECHQVTMPASHNNLWRLKTHGIQAAWDRSRCMVCHEQDSCVACHESNRPQSHTAAWRQAHCLNCHPSENTGTGCTECHKDASLRDHPDPHGVGWRDNHCYSCHIGAPAPNECMECHPGGNSVLLHQDFWPEIHDRGGMNPNIVNWCHDCHEPASSAARMRKIVPSKSKSR